MDLPPVDALNWLSQQAASDASIEDLVAQGWMGCALQDLLPWLADRQALARIAALSWQKTAPEADGEVALMTADTAGLDALLEWMLETRGECPQIYAPEQEPEVPAAMPLLRPIATHLPADLSSADVVDDVLLQDLEQLFAPIKQAFGNQAHLISFDYGAFADCLEKHNNVLLQGEFIDLSDGEIFAFVLDGRRRKLKYRSTGRHDAGFRRQVDAGAAADAEDPAGP